MVRRIFFITIALLVCSTAYGPDGEIDSGSDGDDGGTSSDSGVDMGDPDAESAAAPKIQDLQAPAPGGLDQTDWFSIQKFATQTEPTTPGESVLVDDTVTKVFGAGAALTTIPGRPVDDSYGQYFVLKYNDGANAQLPISYTSVGSNFKSPEGVTYEITGAIGQGSEGSVYQLVVSVGEQKYTLAAKSLSFYAPVPWSEAASLMFNRDNSSFFAGAASEISFVPSNKMTSTFGGNYKEMATSLYHEVTIGAFLNRFPDSFVTTYGVVDNGFRTGSHFVAIMLGKEDGDLTSVLSELPPLEQIEAIRQVFSGVATMHANHLVHGDVRARNTFYTKNPDGTLNFKLGDFGGARPTGFYKPEDVESKVNYDLQLMLQLAVEISAGKSIDFSKSNTASEAGSSLASQFFLGQLQDLNSGKKMTADDIIKSWDAFQNSND